jgi:hypothetical protein
MLTLTQPYRLAQAAIADLKSAVYAVLANAGDQGYANAQIGRLLGIYVDTSVMRVTSREHFSRFWKVKVLLSKTKSPASGDCGTIQVHLTSRLAYDL